MDYNEQSNRRRFKKSVDVKAEEPDIRHPFVLKILELFWFQIYMIYWILSRTCTMLFRYSKVLVFKTLIWPIGLLFQVILGFIDYIWLRFNGRSFLSLYKLLFLTILLFFLNAKYIQTQSQEFPEMTPRVFTSIIHTTEDDFDTVQAMNLISLRRLIDVIKTMEEGNKKVWQKVAEEAKEVKTTIDIVKSYFEEKVNRLWGRVNEQQRQIENVEKEVFKELGRRHSEFESEQEERILNIQKNLYNDIEDTVQRYLYSSGLVVPDMEDEEKSLSIQTLVESITTSILAKEEKPDLLYLEHMIDKFIQKYHQDVLNSADFALKQRGAYILYGKTSSTFHSSSVWKRALLMFVGITLPPATTPEMAISPGNQINDCWSMYGDKGTLGISLSEPIHINGVTIEHPSKEILLDQIKSAPKEMEVYGIYISPFGSGKEQVLLGSIFYDINSSQMNLPIQSFDLRKKDTIDSRIYVAVQIKILSNWGDSERTDIYRIRVHGVPTPIQQIDH